MKITIIAETHPNLKKPSSGINTIEAPHSDDFPDHLVHEKK